MWIWRNVGSVACPKIGKLFASLSSWKKSTSTIFFMRCRFLLLKIQARRQIWWQANAGTVLRISKEIHGSYMYTPRSDPHMHDFKVTRSDPPKWPAPAPARPPQKWFPLSNKKVARHWTCFAAGHFSTIRSLWNGHCGHASPSRLDLYRWVGPST